MSHSVLKLFALLLIAIAAYAHHEIGCGEGLSHHLSENDGDIKADFDCNDGLGHLLSENEGDIKGINLDDNIKSLNGRTFTIPTTLPSTFRPIPGIIQGVTPAPVIIAGQTPPRRPVAALVTIPIPTLTTPKPTISLPLPAPTESAVFTSVCGKKGNCYQWFDEEWELILDGYKRCNARDERRAKRYCCIQ